MNCNRTTEESAEKKNPPCEETYHGKGNISQMSLIKTVCIPAITGTSATVPVQTSHGRGTML